MRPNGYQEILARRMGAICPTDAKLVEAGADAYEEALKSECRISIEPGQIVQTDRGADKWHQFDVKGYLVFIPEDC